VKIVTRIAGALALVCVAGLAARVAGSGATSVSRNIVVVSTTADVVNGKVSSLSALKAKPGRDGISLREALKAVNNTGGKATVYIMFSARLNGKTIEVRSELPPIHRNHVVLEGIAPNGAPARVTLDGRRAARGTLGELLLVQASEVTVRWLRFTGVDPRLVPSRLGRAAAVVVRQGRNEGIASSPGPRRIANVQIVDDVFDNRGITLGPRKQSGPLSDGLLVGTVLRDSAGANTHLSGLTVARDTFLDYNDDAVGVWESAAGDTADGVVIRDNTFDQNEYAIELAEGDNGPRQTGTQVIGNTINGGSIGITLDSSAMNGSFDGTLIDGNSISGVQGSAINLDAQAPDALGGAVGSDVISNTQIVDNAIRADLARVAGIYMAGDTTTSSPPSRVSAVTIENDTFVNEQQGSLLVAVPGASGNQITGVTIRNSILWEPSGAPPITLTGPVPNHRPDVVTNSLISGPDWAGTNGNINGDPHFVNESLGDFHLAASSPAINAGTTIGAPGYDISGARRDASPDIGAFEFGAVSRPVLTVIAEQLGGSGTVTSSPAGINCGTACSARFDPNTTVTLTAKPGTGSRFLGWQHGCSGKARCTITIDSAKSVTARFAPQ
jgi:hypothetical protein